MNELPNPNQLARPLWRRSSTRVGAGVTLLGLLVFIFGARPDWFGLDRSPVIGFVQIAVFLIGLGIICIGGYITVSALWNGAPKSITSDIGLRVVSTGFIIALASGMADVFGFGSENMPNIPSFGFWQTVGVAVGQVIIGIGLLMSMPWQREK